MIYLDNPKGTLAPVQVPPTPNRTPPFLDGNIRRLADEQEATRQANIGKAQLPTPERPTEENLNVTIVLDTIDSRDDVADFIEAHDGFIEGKGETSLYTQGPWILAWFHPSLINEVSKLEGVLKIEEKPRPINNSSKNQDNLTDLDIIHGVNTWHSAAIIHPASSIANTVIDAIRNRFVQR